MDEHALRHAREHRLERGLGLVRPRRRSGRGSCATRARHLHRHPSLTRIVIEAPAAATVHDTPARKGDRRWTTRRRRITLGPSGGRRHGARSVRRELHAPSGLASRSCVQCLCVRLGARAAQEHPAGFADPVLGRWDLTVEGVDGPYPSWPRYLHAEGHAAPGELRGALRQRAVRDAAPITTRRARPSSFRCSTRSARRPEVRRQGRGRQAGRDDGGREGPTINRADACARLDAHVAATWGAPMPLLTQQRFDRLAAAEGGQGICWSIAGGCSRTRPPAPIDL